MKLISSCRNDRELKAAGYGYAYPVVKGKDISKVWDLRKAGLGVLSNMKGDRKASNTDGRYCNKC